jgi:hypothetical protein
VIGAIQQTSPAVDVVTREPSRLEQEGAQRSPQTAVDVRRRGDELPDEVAEAAICFAKRFCPQTAQ